MVHLAAENTIANGKDDEGRPLQSGACYVAYPREAEFHPNGDPLQTEGRLVWYLRDEAGELRFCDEFGEPHPDEGMFDLARLQGLTKGQNAAEIEDRHRKSGGGLFLAPHQQGK